MMDEIKAPQSVLDQILVKTLKHLEEDGFEAETMAQLRDLASEGSILDEEQLIFILKGGDSFEDNRTGDL